MPVDNNRNSRDDNSKKPFRKTKSSPGFTAKTSQARSNDSKNEDRKKLFDSDNKEHYKPGYKKGESKSSRDSGTTGKPFEKNRSSATERKPYGKIDDGGFKKTFDKRNESSSERKPSYNKPDSERFAKPTQRRPKIEGGKFEPRNSEKKFRKEKPGFTNTEKSARYGKSETGKPYTKDFKPRPKRDYPTSENKPAITRSKKPSDDGLIRLNRYISNAGICSRRKADELIQAGVITVNGEAVNELGAKVNPMKDVIRYNGETLKREKMVYVLLNKPKDYITTTDDPHERRTVMQLVEKASKERIYPVGRLDRNTTGLLLMTNDGDLTDKLSHPKNNVVKIYNIELNRSLPQGDLNKIAYGLELEDGIIKPDEVTYVQGGSKREIGIQIHSGKNRIVRRIFEHLGYEVVKLDRVIYANLTKKDLPRGRWRYLEEKEVIQLKHLIK